MNLNTNWLKDLRMELFRRMYERPIHPKDLALHQPPGSHAEVDRIRFGGGFLRSDAPAPGHPPARPGRHPNRRAADSTGVRPTLRE